MPTNLQSQRFENSGREKKKKKSLLEQAAGNTASSDELQFSVGMRT